jgi:hypothetical protein
VKRRSTPPRLTMKKSSVRSKELSCRIVKARAVRDEAAERDGILSAVSKRDSRPCLHRDFESAFSADDRKP